MFAPRIGEICMRVSNVDIMTSARETQRADYTAVAAKLMNLANLLIS